MDKSVQETIDFFKEKINSLLEEVSKTKKLVNDISVSSGGEVLFDDVDTENVKVMTGIRKDEYFNRPLATAVRMYLERRNEAVSIGEIVEALKKGGFNFENEKFAEKNTKITLTKNPAFQYIKTSNSFGLAEWYGKEDKPIKKVGKKKEKPVEEKRGKRKSEDTELINL